tara:strand:+ start:146 stop:487 length:342 start_codon:yes stop_codon:yes gene_type:complete
MELKDIRHQLVLAAQKHYDELMEGGMSPYAIASYHFEGVISDKLSEYVDTSSWKAGDYKELQYSMDASAYPGDPGEKVDGRPDEGLWAVGAVLSSKEAWAMPGFAEAYANSCK